MTDQPNEKSDTPETLAEKWDNSVDSHKAAGATGNPWRGVAVDMYHEAEDLERRLAAARAERRERGLKSIDRICDTCGGEKDSEGRCAMCLQATLTATEAQLAECQKERDEAVRAIPSRCPITGLPFFMMLGSQHDAAVKIPTYGGPFDSYTIPELEDENKPLHEREFTREHFDHDEGSWDDGCECLTIRLIEEDQLSRLTAEVERLRECLQSMLDAYEELHAKYDLGDCEATIAARAAMSNQEKQ